MRPFTKTLAVICLLGACAPAQAEESRIGLAAPLSGSLELLGRQMRDGASVAASAAGAEIFVVDDRCEAQGGAEAAQTLADARVDIVVGFLCAETIEAALPILTKAGIAVVTPGVRAGWLTDNRERNGWAVWRTAPRTQSEPDAIAKILVERWRDQLFAIVDDGTIYGRELSETLRLAAETAGLKPVFVDTYRPQSENQIGLVGRLNRAGATSVFVGGDRDDIAIIARDAAALDYELSVAGGEALRAVGDVPLSEGVLMIGLPEWSDSASEDDRAQFNEAGIVPEGYVAPAYAATEIAIEALARAKADAREVETVLAEGAFDTILGPISFDAKGDLTGNPFRLMRFNGERFVEVE